MLKPVPAAETFSLQPFCFFALFYFASNVFNAITTNSADFLWFLAWTCVSIVAASLLVLALISRRWWRVFSLGLAFPGVFVLGAVLSTIGIDRYQVAFWATYPYYHSQVDPQHAKAFDWSEGGVFLGGGWQSALLYDPSDHDWSDMARTSKTEANLLGFGEAKDLRNSTKDNCDMLLLRRLGGHWYLGTQYYGSGFICE